MKTEIKGGGDHLALNEGSVFQRVAITDTSASAKHSPVHSAAIKDDDILLKQLLESKENIDLLTPRGQTALHLAARQGSWKCIRLLIGNSANLFIIDQDGFTFFHYLVAHPQQNFSEILELLTEDQRRHLAAIKDKEGKTALHHAVKLNNFGIIPGLMTCGFDVNEKDIFGYTPLHLAARYAGSEAVEALCSAGADIFTINMNGDFPYHLAEQVRNESASAALYKQYLLKFPVDNISETYWKEASQARNDFFDPIKIKVFTEKQRKIDAENIENLAKSEIKKAPPPLTDEIIRDRYRQRQLFQNANEALKQYIKALDPYSLPVVYALLAQAELFLLEANAFAAKLWQWQRKSLSKPSDQDAISEFPKMFNYYRLAMQYIATAHCHVVRYSPHAEEVFRVIDLHMQRIIIQYQLNVCEQGQPQVIKPKWHAQRKDLIAHRRRLKDQLEKKEEKMTSSKDLAFENTEYFKRLTIELWQNALDLMESKPPCDYAMACLGSVASDEMCPYSDLELFLIIAQNSEKWYFIRAAGLIDLFIIALCESPLPFIANTLQFTDGVILEPVPSGFRLDQGGAMCLPNNPAQNPEFIGTVEHFIDKQRNMDSNDIGRIILLTTKFVTGQIALHLEYEKQLQNFLDQKKAKGLRSMLERQSRVREEYSLALMPGDVDQFGPTSLNQGSQSRDEQYFNVKIDLYRFPSRTLSNLILYYGLRSDECNISNNFSRIVALEKNKYLSRISAHTLDTILSEVLRLRFLTQIYYGEEKENIFHADLVPASEHNSDQPRYNFSKELMEILVKIYQTLHPLETVVKAFVTQKWKKTPFLTQKIREINSHILQDDSAEQYWLKAQGYERLYSPDQARKYYLLALRLDPFNEAINIAYLNFLGEQVRPCGQYLQSGIQQGIQWVQQLISICVSLSLPPADYVSRYQQISYLHNEWGQAFREAVQAQSKDKYRQSILSALSANSQKISREEVCGIHLYWQEELKRAPFSFLIKEQEKLMNEFKTHVKFASLEEEGKWQDNFKIRQLAVYQKSLLDRRLKDMQKMLVILNGLILLEQIQIDRQNAFKKAEDAMHQAFLKFITPFMVKTQHSLEEKSKRLPEMRIAEELEFYKKVYQGFSDQVRQIFRVQLQIRLEQESKIFKETASPKNSVLIEFIQNLLQEMFKVPNVSSKRLRLDRAKTPWERAVIGLLEPNKNYKNFENSIISPSIIDLLGEDAASALFSYDNMEQAFPGEVSRVLVGYPDFFDIHVLFLEKFYHHFIGHGVCQSEFVRIEAQISLRYHNFFGNMQYKKEKITAPLIILEKPAKRDLSDLKEKVEPIYSNFSHQHVSELVLAEIIFPTARANYSVQPILINEKYYSTFVKSIYKIEEVDHCYRGPGYQAHSPRDFLSPKINADYWKWIPSEAMRQGLDPGARDRFCCLDPIDILYVALQNIDNLYNRYKKLFPKSESTSAEYVHHNSIGIFLEDYFNYESLLKNLRETCKVWPSSLFTVNFDLNIIMGIYSRMRKLQNIIKENPHISLRGCIESVIGEVNNDNDTLENTWLNKLYSLDQRWSKNNKDFTSILFDIDKIKYYSNQLLRIQEEIATGCLEDFSRLIPIHQDMVINGDRQKNIIPFDWKRARISDAVETTDLKETKEVGWNSLSNLHEKIMAYYCQPNQFRHHLLLAHYAGSPTSLLKILNRSPFLQELDLSFYPHADILHEGFVLVLVEKFDLELSRKNIRKNAVILDNDNKFYIFIQGHVFSHNNKTYYSNTIGDRKNIPKISSAQPIMKYDTSEKIEEKIKFCLGVSGYSDMLSPRFRYEYDRLPSLSMLSDEISKFSYNTSSNVASFPLTHLFLQTLVLSGAPQLEEISTPYLPRLTRLIINDAPKLKIVNLKDHQLEILQLNNCPNLEVVEIQEAYSSAGQLRPFEKFECRGAVKLSLDQISIGLYWFSLKIWDIEGCIKMDTGAIISKRYPFLQPLVKDRIPADKLEIIVSELNKAVSAEEVFAWEVVKKYIFATFIRFFLQNTQDFLITLRATLQETTDKFFVFDYFKQKNSKKNKSEIDKFKAEIYGIYESLKVLLENQEINTAIFVTNLLLATFTPTMQPENVEYEEKKVSVAVNLAAQRAKMHGLEKENKASVGKLHSVAPDKETSILVGVEQNSALPQQQQNLGHKMNGNSPPSLISSSPDITQEIRPNLYK